VRCRPLVKGKDTGTAPPPHLRPSAGVHPRRHHRRTRWWCGPGHEARPRPDFCRAGWPDLLDESVAPASDSVVACSPRVGMFAFIAGHGDLFILNRRDPFSISDIRNIAHVLADIQLAAAPCYITQNGTQWEIIERACRLRLKNVNIGSFEVRPGSFSSQGVGKCTCAWLAERGRCARLVRPMRTPSAGPGERCVAPPREQCRT
jgi:hypothetical protein